MEKSKYIFRFFLVHFFASFVGAISAQNNYREDIYDSYISGDMDRWFDVITHIEKKQPSTQSERLELLNYYYGYIGYLIGTNEIKQAKLYIRKGEDLIKHVLNENPENATAYAYKGSFMGFRMGINKIVAPILGPQSMKYINKAYQMAPEDIQVVADKANLLYFSPGIVGGNKKEALKLYEAVIRLMEQNSQTEKNWFYLNILTSLAQRYEETGEYKKASSIYQKILRKAPSFKWVREELYPSLTVKMQSI